MVDAPIAAIELADRSVADHRDVDGSMHTGRRHMSEPARKPGRGRRPALLIGDAHAQRQAHDDGGSPGSPRTEFVDGRPAPLPFENASYALTIC